MPSRQSLSSRDGADDRAGAEGAWTGTLFYRICTAAVK